MIDINKLIIEATKKKTPDLSVYRLVKAEFLKWQKDNPGKELTDAQQAKIVQKMYDQRQADVDIYIKAKRPDLAEKEALEMAFLVPLLPEPVSEEDIENYTKEVIEEHYAGKVSMKDMKSILAYVQEKYSNASGKIVSKIVKSYL